jgi:hypothetical protein
MVNADFDADSRKESSGGEMGGAGIQGGGNMSQLLSHYCILLRVLGV